MIRSFAHGRRSAHAALAALTLAAAAVGAACGRGDNQTAGATGADTGALGPLGRGVGDNREAMDSGYAAASNRLDSLRAEGVRPVNGLDSMAARANDAAANQPAGGDRVRVGHGDDHACDPGGEQGKRARRRLAVVVAGLERHVRRRAARSESGRAQRVHLRVRAAVDLVPSLADHHVAPRDDAADERVRRDMPGAARRESQRAAHQRDVAARGSRGQRVRGAPRAERRVVVGPGAQRPTRTPTDPYV